MAYIFVHLFVYFSFAAPKANTHDLHGSPAPQDRPDDALIKFDGSCHVINRNHEAERSVCVFANYEAWKKEENIMIRTSDIPVRKLREQLVDRKRSYFIFKDDGMFSFKLWTDWSANKKEWI